MGNDGGSIPTRRELVKEAARNPTSSELKETLKEAQAHRWSNCSVSHKPLVAPVVSDSAGVLYNKHAIIQYLLPAEATLVDREEYAKILQGRVKNLKDVVEVLFENDKDHASRWICPVTSKELGPAVKAVYLVPCGHAFSHEAIKEMKSELCIQCNQAYEEGNVIPILPVSNEESVFLENRMDRLISEGLTHSLKKASGKKRKANGAVKPEEAVLKAEENVDKSLLERPVAAIQRTSSPMLRVATPQSGTSTPKIANGIKDAATASLTARVLEEEEAKKKRRKMMGENENLKSLFTKGGQKHKDGDFMTRGYSIPANARHQ